MRMILVLVGTACVVGSAEAQGPVDQLTPPSIDQPQPYAARRASSYRRDGGNRDAVVVEPGGRHTVLEAMGAGRIVHTWFTIASDDPDYLETTRLLLYWDGAEVPAVDVPFGLFHAVGHGLVRPVDSALVTVVARPELNFNLSNKNVAGFNSYFPMPFGRGARLVVENRSDQEIRSLYYQIDYQEWDEAPSPLRFHAALTETPPEPYPGPARGRPTATNADGAENHLVLEASGAGQFIGVVLEVDASGRGWWEGDEMIWVDGEAEPSIYGTGTEDYFGGAWGFRQEYTRPFHGLSVLEKVDERPDWQAGKFLVYRFHVRDPIPFERSFKMSIERGHNNHRMDSAYRSVAFWYQ
ncbi:MAG: DUF2961 domain-containing protein [Vicinamibacterales bacterium]|nr:DUF2961 domain-containing protein [Vicinamibacterales bacterium]HJO37547.1 glycoside hydrolase family 172 protein [Vicinamibacterales bacterium]